MKLTLQVELSDYSFSGEKWIEYKVLPGSNGWGHPESCHRNLKALPFFISLHELLPVVIKNPVFVPLSLHIGSLIFIWFFVPVWGCWVLSQPHLPSEEREVCDIKWFAQVIQKVNDRVCERRSQLFFFILHPSPQRKPLPMSRIVWCSALLPCQDQKPWLSLCGYIFDLLPALFDRQSIFFL